MHDPLPAGDAPGASELASLLERVQTLAVALGAADSLAELARAAAAAAFDALPGHGVKVIVWDDVEHATLEADAGPEMSARLHCEPLPGPAGPVGEIVVDAAGPGSAELAPAERARLARLAAPTGAAVASELRRRRRERAQDAALVALARLAEHRDAGTRHHVERIGRHCRLIAEALLEDGAYPGELDEAFVEDLARAAALHDIGKVAIPESILLKPGTLTSAEWSIMKTHAEIGARALDAVVALPGCPRHLALGREIAAGHHERWDGKGYPCGLRGRDIPLAARIVAVADVYDALTSERPYERPWTHAEAVGCIERLRERNFDPLVVDAFLRRADQADAIRVRLADGPPEGAVDRALSAA